MIYYQFATNRAQWLLNMGQSVYSRSRSILESVFRSSSHRPIIYFDSSSGLNRGNFTEFLFPF